MNDVITFAGARDSRTGGQPGYARWGQQPGSICLLDPKLPITYPRVRDRRRNVDVPLPTYQALGGTRAAARAALLQLRRELDTLNRSAASSLAEGLEEPLTLHRLGLFSTLGISLKTTNCLESLLAQVGHLTDRVDRWRTSDQQHRWVANALLAIEPWLRRIKGYRHLPLLREVLTRQIHRDPVTETRIA